jgi:hypothetical protein
VRLEVGARAAIPAATSDATSAAASSEISGESRPVPVSDHDGMSRSVPVDGAAQRGAVGAGGDACHLRRETGGVDRDQHGGEGARLVRGRERGPDARRETARPVRHRHDHHPRIRRGDESSRDLVRSTEGDEHRRAPAREERFDGAPIHGTPSGGVTRAFGIPYRVPAPAARTIPHTPPRSSLMAPRGGDRMPRGAGGTAAVPHGDDLGEDRQRRLLG